MAFHFKEINFKNWKFVVLPYMQIDDIGDWRKDLIISFDTKDQIMNLAILLHEFIEALLCRAKGITSSEVDKWDKKPKSKNKKYQWYKKAHRFANLVERKFIEALGRNWKKHQKKIYKIKIKICPKYVPKIQKQSKKDSQ
jgi:hypothetical protein